MTCAEDHGVDDILNALNPVGKYQILLLFVGILGHIPSAQQLLGNVFICK